MAAVGKAWGADRAVLAVSIAGMKLKLLACRGKEVTAWETVDLPAGLMSGGLPSNPPGLAGVIKTTLKRKEFSGRVRVLAALPSLYSVCRIMELPDLPRIKPETVLPQQARRDIGYSAENSLLFWQRLNNQSDGRQFMVVSVPKEPVVAIVQTFQTAEVPLSKLETATFSLCRAVNETDAVILEIDQYGFESTIMRDHIPVITRSQFSGQRPWDAESLPAHVTDALQRIISFHDENNPGSPLSASVPSYLLGSGVSGNPGVIEAANAVLGRPVADFDPPLTYPADFPKSEFAVNIGLVLKEL
ncbi:MAG: hypothetical protein HYX84_01810 [Chloroflexi bacterium]|nr:hypothetical protein [Chloroflexota bacterium]